jgi:cytochrome b pre-mRNA-processing protein 3
VFGRKKKPEEVFIAALYRDAGERARAAELYERCGIPDDLYGRFDALALQAWLTIDRLRMEPDGEVLAQLFFDAMFKHLDLTLREIGVQDLGVGRRIKIMAEGLHGRALAYREALAGRGEQSLAEVLRRNAYGGSPPPNEEAVAALEAYVRAEADRLRHLPREKLAAE